jgi:outer membrane protein
VLHFQRHDLKVAYVDSARLLNGYQAMVEARKDYQTKTVVWQANVDTLVKGVQEEIKKYERAAAGMTPKERQLSQDLIRSKQQQLGQYQQVVQDKARQEDTRLTEAVLKQTNSFLERYGKEHGYAMILAANASGNIAYAEKYLDITDKVLEELNQEYNGGTSVTPSAQVKASGTDTARLKNPARN